MIFAIIQFMKFFALLSSLFISLTLQANPLCEQWSSKETVGLLPASDFPEVSGMVISKKIPGRAYFVNDSGDGPFFYSYDLKTGEYEKVEIKGFKGWDIEALSYGPCGKYSCIYIADIGDNNERRKIIRIAGVIEKKTFGPSASPLFHKILTYPDEATDAEAIVVSEKQQKLYLFSKEFGWLSSSPTKIYQLPLRNFLNSSKESLEKLAEISLTSGFLKQPTLTVTDAALSPDESRLMLLGYLGSVEVNFLDLLDQAEKSRQIELGYAEVATGMGKQTEAGSYTPDGLGFMWTYESKNHDAPLYLRTCDKGPVSKEHPF